MSLDHRTSALLEELADKVRGAAYEDIENRIFTINSIDAMEQALAESPTLPIVLLAFESARPQQTKSSQPGGASAAALRAPQLILKTFSVIVAVEDGVNEQAAGQRVVALDFMDQVRSRVHGVTGVCGRPWRFANEGPLSESMNGVILYAQLWEIETVQGGNQS